MKRFMNSIKRTGGKIFTQATIAIGNKRGSGFVDQAVVILISVVVGALLLTGLYTLFGDTILPELGNRIQDMFNYGG